MITETLNRVTLPEALAANPTAALEDIARAAGVAPLDVLRALPAGEVTFIVNTGPVILEVKGPMQGGTVANGMYNPRGKPISGHLNIEACASLAFVRRKLFGMETRSVQFYGHDGACLFKVYLGRDAERKLIPAQIAAFDALEARLLAEL